MNRHRSGSALTLLLAWLACGFCSAADIAVWDPGTDAHESRFDLVRSDRLTVLAWLQAAGLAASPLDSAALTAGDGVDPAVHPVVVLSSHLVPLAADKTTRATQVSALLSYLDRGGVALCLADLPGRAYFNTAITPRDSGWKLSPEEPRFAWDVPELRNALGLKFVYRPTYDDLDSSHHPTALLKRYWPDAPELRVRLPQAHHVGVGADCYALYDSQRPDQVATIPAVSVMRHGARTAILVNNPGWWSPRGAPWFAGQQALTVALARLALDLQAKRVELPAELHRDLPAEPADIEPLRHRAPDSQVDPDGATPLVRWGRFDGAGWELGEPARTGTIVDLSTEPTRLLPRRLDPGGTIRLPLPARDGASYLRIRLAYDTSDAGLRARVDGQTVLDERLIYVGTNGVSNFGGDQLANRELETNRIVFLPPGPAGVLELDNPGRAAVWFDAIQVEQRPHGGSPVLYGWYCAAVATQPDTTGKFTPPADSASFGALRVDARLNLLGPPDAPDRWAKLDQLYAQYASYHAPLHVVLLGTPEWMAVPASLAEAKSRKRAHICVPDRALYQQAMREWLARYADRFAAFELMNEVDIKQFWIGSFAEYTTLCTDIIPLIRTAAPGKLVISAGSAAQSEDLLDRIRASGMAGQVDWLANHCYSGQAPAWELSQGLYEGHCFARGLANPLFANEQGFVWTNAEWFQGPPAWTPGRQATNTDIALARLAAGGLPRILVFTAGGDSHPYSYADEHGTPRPGYRVVMDYNRLNGPGAVRCDPQLLASGDAPLRGIFCAGSTWADGTVRLVLNPCQSDIPAPTVHLVVPLPDARPRHAVAEHAGASYALPTRHEQCGDTAWEIIDLTLPARTVVTLSPGN